jgi:hypothetical protein
VLVVEVVPNEEQQPSVGCAHGYDLRAAHIADVDEVQLHLGILGVEAALELIG